MGTSAGSLDAFSAATACKKQSQSPATMARNVVSLTATNQLLHEALQRSREEVEALELLQQLQQAGKQQENLQTPRSTAQIPAHQPGRPAAVEEQSTSHAQQQEQRERPEEHQQPGQPQTSRREKHRFETHQQVTCQTAAASEPLPTLYCLYPFPTLHELAAEPHRTAEHRDRSSTSKHLHMELQRSIEALRQQQQVSARQEAQLRKLRAALAAAGLEQEQGQLLLQRKLQKATTEAEEAAEEAAAAKGREKQLLVQIEEQQQKFAAAGRSATAKSWELSRQLQAALTREDKLKAHLKEAQQVLTFMSSLQQELPCSAWGPSGLPRRACHSGTPVGSLSSCSSRRSRRSRSTSSVDLLQQHREGEEDRKLLQEDLPEGFCILEIPAEFQELIERLDTGADPATAATPAAEGAEEVEGGKRQVQGTHCLDSSSGLSVLSSHTPEQTTTRPITEARPRHCQSGSCDCCKTRWELQQRLCRATADLIVKKQLLAAGEAKEQELQKQAAESAATAQAAEMAAAAAEKKVRCLLSENAALQAEVTASAAAQRQLRAEAKAAEALRDSLRLSEKRLELRCEMFAKEKKKWEEQLQYQIEQQHQLIQQLHQQQLMLGTRGSTGENSQPQQQERAYADCLQHPCCSPDAEEAASEDATAAAGAAAVGTPEGPEPLLCALHQIATALHQLKEDVVFVRQQRPKLESSEGASSSQQHLEGTAALLICRWPEGEEAPIGGDGGCSEIDRNGDSVNGKQFNETLERRATQTAEKLIGHVCSTLLALGQRLKENMELQRESNRENSLLRDWLKREGERLFIHQTENAMLRGELNALNTKVNFPPTLKIYKSRQSVDFTGPRYSG